MLVDPGPAGNASDDPTGAVPVQPRPSAAWNIGPSTRAPMARSIAHAVRGASGIVTTLSPLQVTTMVRCPRSMPRALMSAPVASDTRSPSRASSESGRGRPAARARPRPGARRARTVRADGMGLIVQAGSADVRGGRVVEEPFFDGVLVEPGGGAQPTGDRGPAAAARLQVAGETLDVGPAETPRLGQPRPQRHNESLAVDRPPRSHHVTAATGRQNPAPHRIADYVRASIRRGSASPSTDQPFGCGADRQPPTQRSVPPETTGRFSSATSSARVVSLTRPLYQVRIPVSIRRLRRRARYFSEVGDACFHGQRLGDAIAGEEKARSDHCGDEGAAPPDGVG